MRKLMLKVENVSKEYRLGLIGPTTLKEELQRFNAKMRNKEDPTLKFGEKGVIGEKFLALDDVSFAVEKGERVGIIGHNGAGKSTLLKLISRITAPTIGDIWLNGRVASMLEVGTGFHGELTGRENIYMNGAILGMSKKEIDAKIEDIIDFSEVRLFIDTPVKRYSSGMYVKLAFSVAAHLDSEIMIMDEVLAVGDVAFQKKCLDKMNDVSRTEDRTILYVSHNMNTIRQLCERVIVLKNGRIVFDGDTDSGIVEYLGNDADSDYPVFYDYSEMPRKYHMGEEMLIESFRFTGCRSAEFETGSFIMCEITLSSKINRDSVCFVLMIKDKNNSQKVATCISKEFSVYAGKSMTVAFSFDSSGLMPDIYTFDCEVIQYSTDGNHFSYDNPRAAMPVKIIKSERNNEWTNKYWGSIRMPDMQILRPD